MFAAGDKVRCVDAKQAGNGIALGAIYTVKNLEEHFGSDCVRLVECPMDYWYTRRFALVEKDPILTANVQIFGLHVSHAQLNQLYDELKKYLGR